MTEYKDSKGNELQIGDLVSCHGLQFRISGFNEIVGQTMASGDYGDFNISILKLVPEDNRNPLFKGKEDNGKE
jgi:hypothetical protein